MSRYVKLNGWRKRLYQHGERLRKPKSTEHI